ncbi:unnamed protein product [Blumeria hordei]|uniref:Uncharacterized protein n=1 Tax=Blumeria hordei TaxID=2867405 RepID=A0A383UIP8_BLUHO|nr:unnamed protein product [Blumeria hordei]
MLDDFLYKYTWKNAELAMTRYRLCKNWYESVIFTKSLWPTSKIREAFSGRATILSQIRQSDPIPTIFSCAARSVESFLALNGIAKIQGNQRRFMSKIEFKNESYVYFSHLSSFLSTSNVES